MSNVSADQHILASLKAARLNVTANMIHVCEGLQHPSGRPDMKAALNFFLDQEGDVFNPENKMLKKLRRVLSAKKYKNFAAFFADSLQLANPEAREIKARRAYEILQEQKVNLTALHMQ